VGIAGQGVSGRMLAHGFQPAGSGQLYAQLTGLGALLVVALLVPLLIVLFLRWIRALATRTAVPQGLAAAGVDALPQVSLDAPTTDESLPQEQDHAGP
jgi:hypothetical protein